MVTLEEEWSILRKRSGHFIGRGVVILEESNGHFEGEERSGHEEWPFWW